MKTGPASFFDDYDIHRWKSLWTPVEANRLADQQSSLEGKFLKATKSLGKAKTRYYFIHDDCIYTSRKPGLESSYGFLSLQAARLDILSHPDGSLIQSGLKEPLSGFRIYRNQRKVEFFTTDSELFNQWKRFLKGVTILATFHEDFQVSKLIGKGSFARVYLATRKSTGERHAIKAFNKEYIESQDKGRESILNEIGLMRDLEHPGIMKLYETHETTNSLYLVVDVIKGGELLDRIKDKKFLTENEIRTIMCNILEVLQYLETKHILHRDIKPENILMKSHDSLDIILADFGLATRATGSILFKRCGTPGYVAPEILKYSDEEPFYKENCDVFSTGVILYLLLTGKQPFNGHDYRTILKQNKNGEIDYSRPQLQKANKAAVALLKKMLEVNPIRRPSAAECLEAAFLADEPGESIVELSHIHEYDEGYAKALQKRDDNSGSLELKSGGKPAINGQIDTIETLGSTGENTSLGENMQKATQTRAQPSRFGVKPRAGTIDVSTKAVADNSGFYSPTAASRKQAMYEVAIRNAIAHEKQNEESA